MILKGDEFISFFYKTVTTVILYNILEYNNKFVIFKI